MNLLVKKKVEDDFDSGWMQGDDDEFRFEKNHRRVDEKEEGEIYDIAMGGFVSSFWPSS